MVNEFQTVNGFQYNIVARYLISRREETYTRNTVADKWATEVA
jgi:hypothetical protein